MCPSEDLVTLSAFGQLLFGLLLTIALYIRTPTTVTSTPKPESGDASVKILVFHGQVLSALIQSQSVLPRALLGLTSSSDSATSFQLTSLLAVQCQLPDVGSQTAVVVVMPLIFTALTLVAYVLASWYPVVMFWCGCGSDSSNSNRGSVGSTRSMAGSTASLDIPETEMKVMNRTSDAGTSSTPHVGFANADAPEVVREAAPSMETVPSDAGQQPAEPENRAGRLSVVARRLDEATRRRYRFLALLMSVLNLVSDSMRLVVAWTNTFLFMCLLVCAFIRSDVLHHCSDSCCWFGLHRRP